MGRSGVPAGNPKTSRAGETVLTVLDLTKVVAFGAPMPSSDYSVHLQPEVSVGVGLWPTSKTASGFTLNVSAGVVATVAYIAVER